MKRRHFLASLAAGAAASPLAMMPAHAQDKSVDKTEDVKSRLTGYLLTLGAHADLFPLQGVHPLSRKFSVLTSIDLETGNGLATPMPMEGEGHLAMGIGDGRILCTGHHQRRSLVADADHKV